MIDTIYIRAVLEKFEGKGISKGYVPADKAGVPLGMSGVTVATGFDLGQQSKNCLIVMGLPTALIARLAPYLGARRAEAQYILAREPLTLTREEVEVIDTAVQGRYIDETAELFGRAAFEAAPREVQAVAVSLHYQFGVPYRKTSPALGTAWDAMRRGEYVYAAAQLREPLGWSAGHRQYMKRRQAEADLLERASV